MQGTPPIQQCDFHRQLAALKDELDRAMQRVLASGWFILGPELEAFEREFAAHHGAAHGIGVGNGTDALHLAFRALGVGPGDEVLVPVNTAFPTAIAVTAAGATPCFADVDPVTATLDPADLERRLTPRTRAIVPVHLYGFPADLDPILAFAAARGLPVVEDAAQAHGTRYRGRPVGGFGAMSCWSFYPSKNLGALGDGGMVLTNDPELAHRLKMLRNYGQTRRYYHAVTGFNSRLDELQAAILRVKLAHLEGWNARRRELAGVYARALAGSAVELPAVPSYGTHVYHQMVLRTERRDEMLTHLAGQGIQALIHYPVPLHLQEAFAALGYRAGQFPVAERLAPRIFSPPIFPELTEDEVLRIARAVRSFHEQS